jgi:hypothetical protein
VLLPDPQRPALEVDEAALVLQQLERGLLPCGCRDGRPDVVEAVPPQLRLAIVDIEFAAAGGALYCAAS